jgi:hypothetical protein
VVASAELKGAAYRLWTSDDRGVEGDRFAGRPASADRLDSTVEEPSLDLAAGALMTVSMTTWL